MEKKVDNYLVKYKEIFNCEVFYEIENDLKILYKSIFVENEENIGSYCIVLGADGFYYLGELVNRKIIKCWAKFYTLSEACEAL